MMRCRTQVPFAMWALILSVLILLDLSIAKQNRNDENMSEEEDDNDKKRNFNELTTTARPKGEVVVEKFVETLMASERYLKLVETVERKVNHLNDAFHEKSNGILKQLAKLMRLVNDSPAFLLEETLRSLKKDLDKLKLRVSESMDSPKMRVDGPEMHSTSDFKARLGLLESNVKTVMVGVESIISTISEVKNRQFLRTPTKTDLGPLGRMDALTMINDFRRTLDQKSKKCECKSGRFERSERYPTDCHEIQMQGFNVTGIYKIKPNDMEPFYVLCDLSTAGGAWTVFQNRFDGSQDFYKGWSDYMHGFGNLAGEFWLGLEKLYYITNQKLYELRIELETLQGTEGYAVYSVFTVGPEYEGYRISTLGTYYGTAGDSLTYHAGQKFSTLDMDNDEWKDGSCASEHGGAWWYKECDKSNLNGKYSSTLDEPRAQSIYWISFKGLNSPLAKTKMMIRPLPATKPIDFNEPKRKPADLASLNPLHVQPKGLKAGHDHNRPPYRLEDTMRHEAYFPNYA